MNQTRIMRCPKCGLTATAPPDVELPEEGPVCAMGHEATLMTVTTVEGIGHG